MKYRLEIKVEARQDITEAVRWYEKKREKLGEEFLEEVLSYLEYLELNTGVHQKKNNDNRELILKRFPYVIVYRIINDLVVILAVSHFKLNPTKKHSRK